MSRPAIVVEHVSKQYRIGLRAKGKRSLHETVTDVLAYPFRRFRALGGQMTEEDRFWALQDVSFEVPAGQVVGIIGANGAGKSTLLKILSRITEPTSGRAFLSGRVASLLEVGSGFHRELTGRENIYLNGTILGMRKAEINRKFDEIVAFAEVEKFIDTPVKRYSSGMHTRLAFAVAAHLQPEILLVDEVLAVGDASFQKRCLGKMSDVAKAGRTILFVSHNMAAIESLCSRVILIEDGRLVVDDEPDVGVSAYLQRARLANAAEDVTYLDIPENAPRYAGSVPTIHSIRLLDREGRQFQQYDSGNDTCAGGCGERYGAFRHSEHTVCSGGVLSDALGLCGQCSDCGCGGSVSAVYRFATGRARCEPTANEGARGRVVAGGDCI